ncbi:hypothetical protein ACKWTF_005771 [Chironomus riparius]
MYLRILSVLIILTCFRISSSNAAVNITCEFGYVEDKYTVKISNQTYKSTEKGLKIYGRHINRMKNPDVKVLDASYRYNKLDIVPSTLLQIFVNLAELRMENCGLKRLTVTSFKYCGKIKIMKFGVDEIDIEAGVFKMCESLEVLEFNGNNIKSINSYAFKGLDKLHTLKMDKCNLRTIEPELLLPLFYLDHIHITGNKIEELPNGLFDELEYLKTMNLSNNELTSFSSSFLKRKNHLEIIDLSENNIETLDRMFLENWPNNAALNIESNICIDKKFGHLGTNDLPMIEVVEFFMNCFDEEKTVQPIIQPNSTSTTEEPKPKSSESSESDSDEKSTSESKKKEDIKQKLDETESSSEKTKVVSKKRESENNEHSAEKSKAAIKKNESEDKKDVEKSSEKKDNDLDKKDNISNEKVVDKLVEPLTTNTTEPKDDENKENSRDSPFEFVKESTDNIKQNSSGIIDDKESQESTTKAVPDKSVSSESDSDEDSDEKTTEISTTESTTTTTEATTEATTKKHKKKGKKGKTATEVVTESTVTVAQNETNLEIATTSFETFTESETTEGIEEMISVTDSIVQETTEKVEDKDQLHDYEQATCRFYIDADKNYNCELVNVTQYLKRINTEHFNGYTSENVNGIFFRQSKLFQVPRIVSVTFPNLIELSIEKTNLKVMDDEFIEDCGNIKRINLRNNKIRRVERNSLKACNNLEHIDLSGNPIETIEGGIFDCNPQLSLTFNAMKILPVSNSEMP